MPDIYITKQKNSEGSINDERNVAFAQLRTTGITEITYSRQIRKKFRNKIFVFSELRRTRNIGTKKRRLSRKIKTAGVFGWLVSEFNNVILNILTRVPMRALNVLKLISEFNLKQNRRIFTTEGQLLINNFFSYLKETKILYVKNAKILRFNLTSCGNKLFELKEKNSTFV